MKRLILLPVFGSLALAACTSVAVNEASAPPQAAAIEAWQGELPIQSPWLRSQLPAGAMTYVRIPHPLGLLAMPKGNSLDSALGSQANITNFLSIQQGLLDNLAPDFPPARLLETLRSPIEVAVMPVPVPSGIIATTLSFRSNEAFEGFIAELSQFAPVQLQAPLDDRGFGQLVTPPLQLGPLSFSILVNFDASTGRLAIFASPLADRAAFAGLLEPAAEAPAHPMGTLESQIDDSGQGLLAWVNVAMGLQAGAMMMPPDVTQMLTATGANQLRAIAIGAGVADGKGRLKLMADLGTSNANRLIPVVHNDVTATSVGDPRSLFLVSIPTAAELARIENVVFNGIAPQAAPVWTQIKTAIAAATGTPLEEIFGALGPELMVVNDRAGGYFAMHIQDPVLLDSVLDRWSASGAFPIMERTVRGQVIRYVDLPASFGIPGQAIEQEDLPPPISALLRMRNRTYWIEDGDYLYLASTPQLLMDRMDLGANTSVADWLAGTQRIDMSSSLLAITGSAGNLPKTLYNGYVSTMQGLADLVGAEFDIWSMPTANQLGLPDRGTLGLALNLGEPYVSLELSYESTPADFILGGGAAAVAAAGVAAAIALPALQQHTNQPSPVATASNDTPVQLD